MSERTINLTDDLLAYLRRVGVHEPEVLRRLREETAKLPEHRMQISPEQGAFMGLLVRLMGATNCLEVGTFTGYSSTAVALALPPEGRLVCCDVSVEWTNMARQAWTDAGVADKVELHIGPAVETLQTLEERSFDFAFIDADKSSYDAYYERALVLVRRGGLIAIDNVLWSGRVVDQSDQEPDTVAIRKLNEKIAGDDRVEAVLLPLGDGLTLARVR